MSARPRRRRRSAPRRRVRRWLRRQDRLTRGLVAAVAVLFAAVLALFALLQTERRPPQRATRGDAAPAAAVPAQKRTRTRAVTRATPPAPPAAAHGVARAPAPAPAAPAPVKAPGAAPRSPGTTPADPRAAIVIDDLGQSYAHFRQLAALGLPISVAVIPGLPASARTVREASRAGIELLVHQPMEPHEAGGKDAGEGVLLTSMPPEALRERLRAGIAAVPGAVGMNNHMGSRFTEDAAGLEAVMAELKAGGLFWLDSRTTPATRGLEAARAAGVPAVARDVFLDAEVSEDFVRAQVRRLLETARARGTAVGIGHPHPETLRVLLQMREELLASGVRLVPVSSLARREDGGSQPPLALARRRAGGADATQASEAAAP